MNNKSKYNWKPAVCFTLLLVFTAFVLIVNHNYNASFRYKIDGCSFSTEGTADVTYDEEIFVFTAKDITENKIRITSNTLPLEEGEYEYELQYSLSNVDSAQLDMYSLSYLNSDNTTGKKFISENILGEKSSIKGTFVVDKDITDSVFCLTVPQGAEISIAKITLSSDNVIMSDYYIWLVFAVLAYILVMYMAYAKKELCKHVLYKNNFISGRKISFILLMIMVATSIFAMLPLLTTDVAGGYDLLYHLNRFEGIAQGLKEGQFPVRIHTTLLKGYGYPNSIFYPELFFYFPAILRVLGMSIVGCYKMFVFVINLMTIFIAYISFSKLLSSRLGGILAATLFTISPYRLACIHERCAIGEYLAMAFLPLVFYGLYAVLFGNKKDWKYLCVGAAALLQSHILTTEIAVFFCGIITICAIPKLFGPEKRIFPVLKALVFAVLLNVWFLVPFLLMTLQLNVAVFRRDISLAKNAVISINELFSIIFLRSIKPNAAGISPTGMGFAFLTVLILLSIYLIVKNNETDIRRIKLRKIGKICIYVTIFTMIISVHLFPWELIQTIPLVGKVVGSLQFVYRTFSVTMMCLSLICAIFMLLIDNDFLNRIIISFAIVIITAFSANIYLDTINTYAYIPHQGDKYVYDLMLYRGDGIALGEYVPGNSSVIDMLTREPCITTSDENITITNVERNGGNISFDYEISSYDESTKYTAIMPLTFYPSYNANINGIDYDTEAGGYNYVQVTFQQQSGNVKVSYRQPTLFVLSTIVTVISILPFIFWNKIEERVKKKKV